MKADFFPLGEVWRVFSGQKLEECLVENAAEIYYVINFNNGHTLDFRGDEDVKFADFMTGWEGMMKVEHFLGVEMPAYTHRSWSLKIRI